MVPDALLSRAAESSLTQKGVTIFLPFCELTHHYNVRVGKITPIFAVLVFIFSIVSLRTVVRPVEFSATLKTYSGVAFRS